MSQLRPLLALSAIFFNSATASPPIYPELASSAEPMLPLERGGAQPPTIAKTRVCWWWLNGNTDKPTITRELEAIKAVDVGGPWQVAFDLKWGGPAAITCNTHSDWTSHTDAAIHHYSGAATFTKTLTTPTIDAPVTLGLGMAESLCEANLNGTKLDVLWGVPFDIDLTQHLKLGANQLEVKVVNLWCNRIIGDASLPEDKRLTHTNITNLKPESQLSRPGLLGPVQLLAP